VNNGSGPCEHSLPDSRWNKPPACSGPSKQAENPPQGLQIQIRAVPAVPVGPWSVNLQTQSNITYFQVYHLNISQYYENIRVLLLPTLDVWQ
jgi:hypothetical protein